MVGALMNRNALGFVLGFAVACLVTEAFGQPVGAKSQLGSSKPASGFVAKPPYTSKVSRQPGGFRIKSPTAPLADEEGGRS
jgi:hypothetical protein